MFKVVEIFDRIKSRLASLFKKGGNANIPKLPVATTGMVIILRAFKYLLWQTTRHEPFDKLMALREIEGLVEGGGLGALKK